MRKTKTINVDDREIVVKELTVAEVDQLLTDLQPSRLPHPAELLLDPDIPVNVVVLSTGLTAAELAGDIAPSDLALIWAAVAEVNCFLSKLMVRLADAGQAMITEQPSDGASAG